MTYQFKNIFVGAEVRNGVLEVAVTDVNDFTSALFNVEEFNLVEDGIANAVLGIMRMINDLINDFEDFIDDDEYMPIRNALIPMIW